MTNTTFHALRELPDGNRIVSIGTFDGVHLGHQYLLQVAESRARELQVPLLVMTFEPNPAQVIRPQAFRGRLNTPAQKLEHLRAAGAGEILVLPFTDVLMHQTPEEFMGAMMEATHADEVWVGEEFVLGHNRSGDIARLTTLGQDLGFVLHAVPRREFGDQVVSSSRIRQHVLNGEPDRAERLLGYPYRVTGEVIKGAQLGRTIGFPTANVEPPPLLVPLPDGIYASIATIAGTDEPLPAMTYIGTRPALNTGARLIETHILDFSEMIYGQHLHCDFIERLRPDATFESVDHLVAQLGRDEIAARAALERHTAAHNHAD